MYRFNLTFQDSKHQFVLKNHPSETLEHLVMRALAFALYYRPNFQFLGEVCQGNLPVICTPEKEGKYPTWVEVGCPRHKKLTVATRLADDIIVLSHENSRAWKHLVRQFFKFKKISFFLIDADVVDNLNNHLAPINNWHILQDGEGIEVNGIKGKYQSCVP